MNKVSLFYPRKLEKVNACFAISDTMLLDRHAFQSEILSWQNIVSSNILILQLVCEYVVIWITKWINNQFIVSDTDYIFENLIVNQTFFGPLGTEKSQTSLLVGPISLLLSILLAAFVRSIS